MLVSVLAILYLVKAEENKNSLEGTINGEKMGEKVGEKEGGREKGRNKFEIFESQFLQIFFFVIDINTGTNLSQIQLNSF